jgi:hypothetical protein
MNIIDLDPQDLPATEDGRDAEPPPRATEPLFRVNGKVYSIPKAFTPAESLQGIEIGYIKGNGAALLYMMRVALGDEGFEALKGAANMTPEQYKVIHEIISERMIAAAKAMTGN